MLAVHAPMSELMPELIEYLQNGCHVHLGITGTSMSPLLRDGKDKVLLCQADRPFKKGDILLYKRDNSRYVLHRVIGFSGQDLLCCGDNQWRKETVRPAQVLAVVCAYYRGDQKKSLNAPGYRLYLMGLPLRRLYKRLRAKLSSYCRKRPL